VFIALAITTEDEADVGMLGELIRTAKLRGTRVIIVADSVSPGTLHQLLKLGADDFLPYPLSDGALHDAVERIRKLAADAAAGTPSTEGPVTAKPTMGGKGAIFAVQNLAGGTGATTLAVNLAWELANIDKKKAPSVCLMDFDLQFGTVATYLDLPRREIVLEFLAGSRNDGCRCLPAGAGAYGDKLSVFTSPRRRSCRSTS
jgi:pilus assembly protein CpaE